MCCIVVQKPSRSWINICGNHGCKNNMMKRQQRQADSGTWNHKNDFYLEPESNSNCENILGWGLGSVTQVPGIELTFHFQTKQITARSSWHLSVDSHLHRFQLLFRFQIFVNIFKSEGATAVKVLNWIGVPFLFSFLFFGYIRHWVNYRKSKRYLWEFCFKKSPPNQEFLNYSTIDILGCIILCPGERGRLCHAL